MRNTAIFLFCLAPAVPQTTAAAATKDEPVVARARALSKADAHGAAQHEIATALKWTQAADTAQRKGTQEQAAWLRFRAGIQLALAERLVALSRLRHQHRQLVRKIGDLRQGAAKQARELEERKAFLQALREMR